MSTFIRVQVASILGSLADYLITIGLVAYLHCWYILANFLGNLVGGTIQFMLCRKWAFPVNQRNMQFQVIRFIFVFIGNLLLSAAGVYILTNFFGVNYIISKTIISVLLGTTYNYLLQKKFIFA